MSNAPLHRLSLIALALAVTTLVAPVAPRADDAAMPAGAKGDVMMWFKDAESKMLQLADAMPEGKYSWRPGKGVRSVGEVYMHVAAANFGIPGLMGIQPPAGFDFNAYEKSLTKKADIEKALKDSFAHVENAFMNASDADMDKKVDIMGNAMSEHAAFLLLLAHNHEHLGQSIAYARMNGVVPPWTAKQDAAMKAKMDDMKKK